MRFWDYCSKCLYTFIILVLVLIFVPGIPPHVSYSAFNVDPAYSREGSLAQNFILDDAERMYEGYLKGPESIASRANDELFVSLHNGDIVRVFGNDFDKSEVVANLGPGCAGPWEERICGRPLGLRFASDQKLLIADAYLGLSQLDLKTGSSVRLIDPNASIDGLKPLLIDDLDIDSNGNIYWSDASTTVHLTDGLVELVSDPSGRLLKYDPRTKTSKTLLSKLHFANGVQLSPDQTFVLVAETYKHRVTRYWLKGPKAGKSEIFVSKLPGMPDNIRARKEGGYYVSLITTRRPDIFDLYAMTSNLPRLRKVVTRATALVQLTVDFINKYIPNLLCAQFSYSIFSLDVISRWIDYGESIVVEVDESGKIVGSLQGSKGIVSRISQTQQVGDYLFFASPYVPYLGRIHVDKKKLAKSTYSASTEKPRQKEEL